MRRLPDALRACTSRRPHLSAPAPAAAYCSAANVRSTRHSGAIRHIVHTNVTEHTHRPAGPRWRQSGIPSSPFLSIFRKEQFHASVLSSWKISRDTQQRRARACANGPSRKVCVRRHHQISRSEQQRIVFEYSPTHHAHDHPAGNVARCDAMDAGAPTKLYHTISKPTLRQNARRMDFAAESKAGEVFGIYSG